MTSTKKQATPQEQIGKLQAEIAELKQDIAAFERVTKVLDKQLRSLR